MKSIIKPLRDIGFLTIALTLALIANFAYGQWANPTATPPAGNVTAPVNIGTSAQTKDGALGVNELTVFGRGYIESPAPTLTLNDTDADHTSFWWHVNNSRTYLLADRNNDGSWTGEGPWPLEIGAGPAASDDFLRVSNQVRAYEYCDRSGTNCVNASGMGSGGGSGIIAYMRGQGKAFPAPPANLSAWPDWIYCARGLMPFRAAGGNVVYGSWPIGDNYVGAVHFNNSGQQTFNNVGSCGSSDIRTICQSGNCGFYNGGGPATDSSQFCNAYGCSSNGECSAAGCPAAGESCNQYGCSSGGSCTAYGCP